MKRRQFLKGAAGAALAAPFLPSLMSRKAFAAGATGPQRLVIFYTQNGCLTNRWFPKVENGAIDATAMAGTTLQPLSDLAGKLLFARGLAMFPKGTVNGYFDPHDQGLGSKLTCAPTNYQAHINEMTVAAAQPGSQVVTTQSVKIGEAGMFLKANSALIGPTEGIAIRFPERRNDHEAEIVMVIGKAGSNIPRERALDYVAGYCLGLDMTVRGREDRSFRKSIDGYAVLGPWMVTADEIADPDALPLSLKVNGETRQDSNTNMLIYDCRRLIEFASSFYTLYPGDLIYTGTPEGVGPVKPGDVIVCRSSPVLGELKVAVRAHDAGGVRDTVRVGAKA